MESKIPKFNHTKNSDKRTDLEIKSDYKTNQSLTSLLVTKSYTKQTDPVSEDEMFYKTKRKIIREISKSTISLPYAITITDNALNNINNNANSTAKPINDLLISKYNNEIILMRDKNKKSLNDLKEKISNLSKFTINKNDKSKHIHKSFYELAKYVLQ